MSLDVEALLQPVSDEEPVGPDLSYDRDFRRISRELEEIAVKERPGDDPAVGPAVDTAVELLGRSKDMWVAAHGFCFSLYSGDLPRCVGLIEVLAGIAERFWENCYPNLDEGSDPAGGRRAACAEIASIGWVVKHLENLYLAPLKTKGRITFKSIAGSADAATKDRQLLAQAPDALRSAIDGTPVDGWRLLAEQLGAVLAASARIVAVFNEQASGMSPDMAPLDGAVKRMKEFADAVVERLDPSSVPAEEPGDEAAGDVSGGPAGGGRSFSGPIATRAQALAQMDAIKAFFQATEPSSPVPMLLDRVKRLAGMDFFQILQNLAPTGVEEANRVLDHNREGEEASYSSGESE